MAEGSLNAGDIYLLLDGGVPGNVGTLLSAFQSQDKVSTTFTILKDLASMSLRRHGRAHHGGDIKQIVTMLAMSRSQINLGPPVKYQTYPGNTDGDVIGPVVLAPPKVQWQATRAVNKKIFGPDLGGKLGQLEAESPEPHAQEAPHKPCHGASVLS